MREPDCFRELLRTRRRACKCSPLEAGFPSQDSVPVRACIIDWDSRHPGGYTTSPLEAGFPSQTSAPVRACIIDWDSRHPGGYTTNPLEAGFPSQDSVPVRACIIDWDSRHPGGYTTSPLEAGFPSQSTITAFVQLLALLITCLFYLKRITVPWGGPIWIEPVPVTVRPARRREFAFPFTARPSTVTPPPM